MDVTVACIYIVGHLNKPYSQEGKIMPKKTIYTPDLERVVSFRVGQQIWVKLVNLSRSQGYSASGWIRNAVFRKLKESGIEPTQPINRMTREE